MPGKDVDDVAVLAVEAVESMEEGVEDMSCLMVEVDVVDKLGFIVEGVGFARVGVVPEILGSIEEDGVFTVVVLASLTVDSPLLATVGSGCSVGIAVPCVLLFVSLSVAPRFPSLPGAVGSDCSPGVVNVVILASFTVDCRLPPLLATVGWGLPVGTGVSLVVLVGSLSVASTLSSLLATVVSGCSEGVFNVVILASLNVDLSLLLATVGSGCPVGTGFPGVLLLESLSVASTLLSLLETVGPGCSDDICLVVVFESLIVDLRFSPLLTTVG